MGDGRPFLYYVYCSFPEYLSILILIFLKKMYNMIKSYKWNFTNRAVSYLYFTRFYLEELEQICITTYLWAFEKKTMHK